MLYGAIFGCLSPILSIAAILSYKSPFVHLRDEVFPILNKLLLSLTTVFQNLAVWL